MREDIIKMYEELFSKLTGNIFFSVRDTARNNDAINNFVERLDEIGEENIWNFMCYGFFRYEGAKTAQGKNVVYLNWVIGDSAIEEWKSKSPERWFVCSQWKIKNDLSNPLTDYTYKPSEEYLEELRRRYKKLPSGIMLCAISELYSPGSKECQTCKNKDICSNRTKYFAQDEDVK